MPPFLSSFRSRTSSLLDNITGIIPDSPSDSTSKDQSLTCRRCGNRFRDGLELSSHFNLLPHHSDYKDSYDFASFTRPKGRRQKVRNRSGDASKTTELANAVSPITSSFSESHAFYHGHDRETEKDKEKENEARPGFLRKFPTLSNLSTLNLSAMATGDQPLSPSATDYADQDGNQSPFAKAKGKQKAMPRLPRDGSFHHGQLLASSDEEEDRPDFASSSLRSALVDSRSRARSAAIQGLTSEALPPTLPAFEWQTTKEKAPLLSPDEPADDAASIASDSSFRTAASIDMVDMQDEKAQLKAGYGNDKSRDGSKHSQERIEQRPFLSRDRHASESNLLLESMNASHDDAPPSYHELQGDADPFDHSATSSRFPWRHTASRSDGFVTMPASPSSRSHHHAPQHSQRSINDWSLSADHTPFPVATSSLDDHDRNSSKSRWRNDEDDLYNPISEKPQRAAVRPTFSSKSTEVSLPPLVASSSISSTPSPSSPMTPFPSMADTPLSAPPLALLLPNQASKSKSSAGRRSRNAIRAKSDATAPSTRCPTCFVKFSSLDKTLEHLDNSDCGAVDFESGIV